MSYPRRVELQRSANIVVELRRKLKKARARRAWLAYGAQEVLARRAGMAVAASAKAT